MYRIKRTTAKLPCCVFQLSFTANTLAKAGFQNKYNSQNSVSRQRIIVIDRVSNFLKQRASKLSFGIKVVEIS